MSMRFIEEMKVLHALGGDVTKILPDPYIGSNPTSTVDLLGCAFFRLLAGPVKRDLMSISYHRDVDFISPRAEILTFFGLWG